METASVRRAPEDFGIFGIWGGSGVWDLGCRVQGLGVKAGA